MGFFGTIAKLAGKVVKAGASKLTMGASDLVLKQLKNTGQLKQAAKQIAAKQIPQQTQATLAPAPAAAARAVVNHTDATIKRERARIAASGKRQPIRKMKKAAKPKVAKVKKKSGRTPPKGGLDLAAIARQWKAAGKPGTWISYIKANPIKKK